MEEQLKRLRASIADMRSNVVVSPAQAGEQDNTKLLQSIQKQLSSLTTTIEELIDKVEQLEDKE